MCGELRIPRDMCAGNTIPGETHITVTAPTSYPTIAKFLSATQDVNLPFTGLNWTEPFEQTFASVTSVVPHNAKRITSRLNNMEFYTTNLRNRLDFKI